MLEGLNGKTAIVTGAAGGIGRAIVERLVKEQCNVIAVEIHTIVADPAGSQRHVTTVTADVSTEDGCDTYARAAVEQFGGLTSLLITRQSSESASDWWTGTIRPISTEFAP